MAEPGKAAVLKVRYRRVVEDDVRGDVLDFINYLQACLGHCHQHLVALGHHHFLLDL